MHPGAASASASSPAAGESGGGTGGIGAALLRSGNTAVGVVVGALLVMTVIGAAGLWLARASGLPGDSFGPVLAATMVMALGAPVSVQGSAGFVAQGSAGVEALPLSLSLAGALVAGYAFLWPLRHRAVVYARELLAKVLLTAALWAGAVALLAVAARHSFVISTGNSITDQITGALGAQPTVGFRIGVGVAVGYGLLWLAVVLVLAFAVSRAAPSTPGLLRFQGAVRPAGSAVLVLLLGYVLLALVAGIVTAVVHGPARDTMAVVLLALPNLAWLALGLGLGATWHGHLNAGIGLPMPKVLSEVLRSAGTRDTTVSLGSLAHQDGRVWVLPVLAGVALLCCGIAMGRASGGRTTAWRHALGLGLAMALTMLLIGLLTRVSAAYGLSLLGVGGTGGISGLLGNLIGGGTRGLQGLLAGSVTLIPDLSRAVLLGALWGAVAGMVGGWLGARLRRGERGSA